MNLAAEFDIGMLTVRHKFHMRDIALLAEQVDAAYNIHQKSTGNLKRFACLAGEGRV